MTALPEVGVAARSKTALTRVDYSRPVRQALRDEVLRPSLTVLDYGCGLGGDVDRLLHAGFDCTGWDPNHRPDGVKRPADVVNIGYVVNVIENAAERAETLRDAWNHALGVLVVAARLREEAKGTALEAFEDGGITRAGTFQKFYGQSELREWIDATLGATSVAAAPGVFYVFRKDSEREAFLATRYHRRVATPRLRRSDELFEQHRAVLDPLMLFVTDRGRLPGNEEVPHIDELLTTFGSIRRAFRLVLRVTGEEQWERIKLERTEDLLVFIGLSRFKRRPKMSQLPRPLQLDVKALFGSYTRACDEADELLFSLGRRDLLEMALSGAGLGKRTGNGLYVHVSALDRLPSILRLFEGCARTYIGTVEGANLVKLHRDRPVVSYLAYPGFDEDPHPKLHSSVIVDLQSFDVQQRDYRSSVSPPILHRKELFVAPDYPLREQFEQLTNEEEAAGLLENASSIGTLEAWQALLAAHQVEIVGHHLHKKR